jgi:hypothetical protein
MFAGRIESQMTRAHIAIVIPVFNDWPALARLLENIDTQPELANFTFSVLAIDDGSNLQELDAVLAHCYSRFSSIKMVELACNLGHQRAIAIGLVQALKAPGVDCVVVMDSDGEDRPQDIRTLIDHWRTHPESIICAQRSRRSEPLTFKISYAVYKLCFRILTGARIDFGNFCLIPRRLLGAVCHNSAIWNNLAAALVRAPLPIQRIPTERGLRYAGQSHMNWVSLIMHGLTAISVHGEVVLVRLLISFLALSGISVLGLLVVVAVRVFTRLAIPGWASNVGGSLIIILLQSLLLALISVFTILSTRNVKPVIPIVDADTYVVKTQELLRPGRQLGEAAATFRIDSDARGEACA